MKDPDKIWEEANALKNDRYRWKMGLNHKDCNKAEFVQKMEKTYKYLKESSSTIFNNLIEEDNIEMDKLKYMLDMMRTMGEKKTTYENASKEVGQRFADEYIKPLVDKLENEKKEKENMEQENNDNKTSIEELEEVD